MIYLYHKRKMAEREIKLFIDDDENISKIIHALNTLPRRKIMSLLRSSCYSIIELSKRLKMPISTTSFHINVLRKAGLINVVVKKNSRGNAKIVSRQIDNCFIDFIAHDIKKHDKQFSMEIPIGSFVDAFVSASCGMADLNGIIIADDLPGAFFSPLRYDAQIIWFSKGYIEYRIPNYMMKDKNVKSIILSMEICSEAPNYRNDWESDITFWINGIEVASFVSPGDFGGRRGRLNPEWWSDYSTQYGIIKTLRIKQDCICLDETPVSTYNIEKLQMNKGDYFTFRIGIKENARHQGGVNLFGEKFGDFSQGLMYIVDYDY